MKATWHFFAAALATGAASIFLMTACSPAPVSASDSDLPLVRVGPQIIRMDEYRDRLARDGGTGQKALSNLVFGLLARQAAAKAGVLPTAKDVDARISYLKRRDPALFAKAEARNGITNLREELANSLALENLRIQHTPCSDQEAATYYARHKRLFVLPLQVETTTMVAENAVDAAAAEKLLRRKVPLNVIGRQPRLHVVGLSGYQANLSALSPAAQREINEFVQQGKMGSIKTFQTDSSFLIFEITKKLPAGAPPFSQIRDQVIRMAKLGKSVSGLQEAAALYVQNPPQFYDEKYKAYFDFLRNVPPPGAGSGRALAQ